MKIGFIGLGKMGSQMVRRILDAGHEVVVTDVDAHAVDAAAKLGATSAADISDMITKLDTAIIWLMIPAQFVDGELDSLTSILPAGSIVIDGGNSDFRLSKQRAKRAADHGIEYIDVGTSGGILGYGHGYSMMVGGNDEPIAAITPVLDALSIDDGWQHLGPSGAGHYIKMVHNAIEYGMMQSYAEGYRLLKEGPYPDINLGAVANVWQKGSIIESQLNHLMAEIMVENPTLTDVDGTVAASGEAKWALEIADEHHIAMPAIQSALDARTDSQNGTISYTTKLLAATRNKFGGHAINTKADR